MLEGQEYLVGQVDLEGQEDLEELVDKFFRGDSANLVAVPVTGRANVLEFVHTALSVDINQNGVIIRIRHPGTS